MRDRLVAVIAYGFRQARQLPGRLHPAASGTHRHKARYRAAKQQDDHVAIGAEFESRL